MKIDIFKNAVFTFYILTIQALYAHQWIAIQRDCAWDQSAVDLRIKYSVHFSRLRPTMSQKLVGNPPHIKHHLTLYKVRQRPVSVIILQLWGLSIWTMFSSAVPYKNQQYSELKKHCINDKTLFEDPEFPAVNSSLYFKKPPPGFVEWKRPGVSRMGGRGSSLTSIRELKYCYKGVPK